MKDYTSVKSYKENGFVIVKNIIEQNELFELRQYLDSIFKEGPLKQQRFTPLEELLKNKMVYRQFFNKKLVDKLKEVMGNELFYMPDFVVHHNAFGVSWPKVEGGWHIDCGFEYVQRKKYLFGTDYLFAKVGIYLQNWDNDWGGGIMAIPGSHKWFYRDTKFDRIKLQAKLRGVVRLRKLGFKQSAINIKAKAGDAVLFDARLLHKATLPSNLNIKKIKDKQKALWSDIPREHTKYVLYGDACHKHMVRDHMISRLIRALIHESDVLPPFDVQSESFYTRHNAFQYPKDYPPEFVQLAEQMNIQIATFHETMTEFFKQKVEGKIDKLVASESLDPFQFG